MSPAVPAGTPPSTRRRWAGLLFLSLGVAMIIVDGRSPRD
jgi:hypothetical protein